MNLKIRKGDMIEVISGRSEDKGKRSEVIRVIPGENRLVAQGVNMRIRHQRQVQTQGRTVNPGRVHFEAPIHVSNVMLVCPKCNKPTRVALSREGGKAQRICKKCDSLIDE
jgi:large subunit ribosomal protein L24